MKAGFRASALLFAALLAARASVHAAEAPNAELEKKIQALGEQVEALRREVREGPKGGGLPLEWGGFTETTYQNFGDRNQKADPAGLRDTADLERVSLDATYRYSETIKTKVELEILHAGAFPTNNKGTVDIEQAWAEDALRPYFGLRGGLIVVPLGLVNEKHRPNAYHGVFRPSVEQLIIPSTWREIGAGFFGDVGPVSYRTYVVSGLSAASNSQESITGLQGSTGFKGGRSLGAASFTRSAAWAARADYGFRDQTFAGAGVYIGKANQGLITQTVPVTLWEGHAQADWRGAELRALYAEGTIGNADAVNAAQVAATPTFKDFVGKKVFGGYVTLAYNVLAPLKQRTDYLAPFVRYERYDTADRVPAGFAANPATSRVDETLGFDYRPIRHLVVKAEYQWLRNEARTGVNEWNLGLGWDF